MSSEADPHVTDQRQRCPVSAWLVLVLLVVVVANRSISFMQIVFFLMTNESQVIDIGRAFLELGWRIALVLGSVVTSVAVWRQRAWGRWAGLCAIAAWGTWTIIRPAEYLDELQGPSAWFARYMASPLLCVWWAYAFAFSRKARNYFKSEVRRAV